MANDDAVQTSRQQVGRASRGPMRPLAPVPGVGPWDEAQVDLAHDIAVLINLGFVAAMSDGPEIRYAAADDGREVF